MRSAITFSLLWRKFGRCGGISRSEFFDYFEGISRGIALELTNCRRLCGSLTLGSLRRLIAGFQPPQFFVRLEQDAPLLAAISQLTGWPEQNQGRAVVPRA